MPNKLTKQAGFTLIELMVVVAIIAILSTIGIGGFSNAQKKARDARRRADIKTIQSAMISSSDTSGNYNAADARAETGGSFPVDPKKVGGLSYKYFLYAPFSETTAVEEPGTMSEILFATNPQDNTGIVCAALEIPNTGNTTDKNSDADPKVAAANKPINEIVGVNEDNTTEIMVSEVGQGGSGGFNLGISNTNGTITTNDCTKEGATGNCNLFCATF